MESPSEYVSYVQYGNYDAIQDAIVQGTLSTSLCDQLWLLHWAAINNRVRIATLLINHGANVNLPVGDLNEVPLQWAARNDGFTFMIQLLLEHKADVHHKNINGHDTLAVACIFGNINIAYILLVHGASPLSVDADGNTPLHCVLHCTYDSGPETKRWLVRLLLNFGADPKIQNTSQGNNCLHKLFLQAENSPVDLWLAYYLCEHSSNAESITSLLRCKNAGNITPFEVAKYYRNLVNIRYFFDYEWGYRLFPRWVSTMMFTLITWSYYWGLQYYGFLYGTIIFGLTWGLLGDVVAMNSLVMHSSRRGNGWAWGVIITVLWSHAVDVAPYISHWISVCIYAWGSVIMYTLFRCGNTAAQSLPFDKDRERICSTLIRGGIRDGPTRPKGAPHGSNIDLATLGSPSVKDSTGTISLATGTDVEESRQLLSDHDDRLGTSDILESDMEARLCTACLADKSQASTHCARCDRCMIALDHHCEFVDNCVGKGNRRMFFFFTASASIGCACASLMALYVIFAVHCDVRSMSAVLISLKSCLWLAPIHLIYTAILAGISSCWIGALAWGQIQLVVAETTTFEVIRGYHDGLYRLWAWSTVRSVWVFLVSGQYRVVRPERCKAAVRVLPSPAPNFASSSGELKHSSQTATMV